MPALGPTDWNPEEPPLNRPAPNPSTDADDLLRDPAAVLERVFGPDASMTPLTTPDRMGRRVHGLDLTRSLSAEQASLLVDLLDRFHILSFPGQDANGFGIADLERVGTHFGAVITHPKNYANYREKNADLRLLPVEERTSTRSNAAFPGEITCIEDADNPAVYVVSNLIGGGRDSAPEIAGGQHWHTDIEFEPIPLGTSLFYVQRAPTRRDGPDGHWVSNPPREPGFYHPDSDALLSDRREALPLDGQTAYTDTAAAFAALPEDERRDLRKVMLRRRVRPEDPGWLKPLVHENPRSGIESLHSPVWASRGKNVAPAQVEGMGIDESRAFFDRLEAHCLDPRFRYDHTHAPGDVTIWSNFATLHVAPPYKRIVDHPDDARLMYRVSCKGEPSPTLPRNDSDEWITEHIQPFYRSPSAS